MAAKNEPLVASNELPDYFDDLVDSQHWISMLLTACGEAQRETLDKASAELDSLVGEMLKEPPKGERLRTVFDRIHEVVVTVRTAARSDIA